MVSANFAQTQIVETNSAYGTVLIEVLDENDNSPVFDEQGYSFALPENFVGYLGKVSASDADSDKNAVIRYSISDSELNHTNYLA